MGEALSEDDALVLQKPQTRLFAWHSAADWIDCPVLTIGQCSKEYICFQFLLVTYFLYILGLCL